MSRIAPVRAGLRRLPSVLVAVALLIPSGCSSGGLEKVSGKVTVDGAPLTMGMVRFVPDASKGNKTPTEPVGEIKKDGTYTLMTNGKEGAPPGWYKVSVTASETPDSSKPFSGKSLVAQQYNNPESSNIAFEVKSGAPAGAYDIKVTSR